MSLRAALLAVLVSLAAACGSPDVRPPASKAADDVRYPHSPREGASDIYFGETVLDPYRWLEDKDNARVAPWLKAQHAQTTAWLARRSTHAAFQKRVLALRSLMPRIRKIEANGSDFYYLRRGGDAGGVERLFALAANGKERLVFDPSSEGDGYALDYYAVSPQGRYVALGLSKDGSEDSELIVLDQRSKRVLPGRVYHTQYGQPSWSADGGEFYYWRRDAATFARMKVYVRTPGTPVEKDLPVFGYGVSGVDIAETHFPFVQVFARAPDYVFGHVYAGASPGIEIWVASRASVERRAPDWRRVAARADGVTGYQAQGSSLFTLSDKGAARRRIVRLDLESAETEEVVAESADVLMDFELTGDGMLLTYNGAKGQSLVRLKNGVKTPITLNASASGSVSEFAVSADGNAALVLLSSWTKAPRLFRVDTVTGLSKDTGLLRRHPAQLQDLETRTLQATSVDGTKVPVTLVLPGERSGPIAVQLVGYGAYGVTLSPSFLASEIAWLERGGAIAIAHVRGGGAKGSAWHEAAMREGKQRSVDDFVAVAELLIKSGVTTPSLLSAWGRSAGGLLVGAALTQRPDLFGAGVIEVGILNLLRFELTPGGPANVEEFGTVTDSKQFASMYKLDPYHAVRAGTRYPPLLLTAGMNDIRVPYWQPAKFAARLQRDSASLTLLHVEFNEGHGHGTDEKSAAALHAAEYTFLWANTVGE